MPVKNILVVDDSPTERFFSVDLLTKAGYVVTTAENGEEGIAKAKAIKPDLILMDVVMPGLNGYQATRTLSRDEETKHIPIIVSGFGPRAQGVAGALGDGLFVSVPPEPTAVTRAKTKVRVVGSEASVRAALDRRVVRASGLALRLREA